MIVLRDIATIFFLWVYSLYVTMNCCAFVCLTKPYFCFVSTGCVTLIAFFLSQEVVSSCWHCQWFQGIFQICALVLLPTCLGSCSVPPAGLIALLYADDNTAQKHSWNNSCSPLPFTPPLLIVSNQIYLLNMKTGRLQGMLGHPHCMQRSWLAPDKRPQLPNERQLHHCLHVTDGWQCWQTGGINWHGYQGETSFSFFFLVALVLSASRCIFIQMQGGWEKPLAWCTCFVKVI